MTSLNRFLRRYESSPLPALAVAGAQEVRFGGWGTGGRPERVCTLHIDCRCAAGSAALSLTDEPDNFPFPLRAPLDMGTAASLDPAVAADDACDVAFSTVSVRIDGETYSANAATQGRLGVVEVLGFAPAPQIVIATSGLAVDGIELTSAFDFERAAAAAFAS